VRHDDRGCVGDAYAVAGFADSVPHPDDPLAIDDLDRAAEVADGHLSTLGQPRDTQVGLDRMRAAGREREALADDLDHVGGVPQGVVHDDDVPRAGLRHDRRQVGAGRRWAGRGHPPGALCSEGRGEKDAQQEREGSARARGRTG